ncbi:MAG: CotH kinase family protein [Bryobacteraceae bacterium]
MQRIALVLFAVGAVGAEPPKKAEELFQTAKVWTVHLKFTAEQWTAMEPKGEPQGGFPFGGGRPPGGPGGPGGPPPPPPGGFGPSMMLAPAFLKGDTNGDKQLSQVEFAALGEKWFADWDTKKAGKLGTDELRGGVMQLLSAGMGNVVRIGGPGQGPGMNFVAADGRRNGLAGAAGIDFPYVHADLDFDGLALRDVAVRYKGNGTFMQSRNQDKKSLKLDLNKYVKGQKLAGLTKLNFHSGVTDASWMNEVLSYRLYRDAKVPAPRTTYARVYITVPGKHERKYFGLYSMVEDIDNSFAQANYGTKDGAIFKPVGSIFEDRGDAWSAYAKAYDPKDEITPAQQKRVIDFAKLVSKANDDEFRGKLDQFLDLEEFARYMAVTTWLSTLDSILGMGQNFYVYLNPKANKFEFLPWDLDHSFGQFMMAASQEQREQLSIMQPWMGSVKLLERVYADERFKKIYLEKMAEFDRTIFEPARFAAQVDEIAKAIRPSVSDEAASKLARFDKVVAGETVAPDFGGFGPPGGMGGVVKPIKGFVTARAASVRDQLAGKSKGQVRTAGGFGPGGGRGGPGGMPPFERVFLEPFDADKSGDISREEFGAGFARWFKTWGGESSLTEAQLREGINKDMNFMRGGGPGRPPQ